MADDGAAVYPGIEGSDCITAQFAQQVYEQLRDLAAGYLGRQACDHTLQPTALVHEAYLKLAHHTDASWRDRAHFMAVAACAMRQIVVDHARAKKALKRGGGCGHFTIADHDACTEAAEVDVIPLDEALRKLAVLCARKSRIVELRFFGGLTIDETAHVLEVSPTTVESDWRFARAWLKDELSREGAL